MPEDTKTASSFMKKNANHRPANVPPGPAGKCMSSRHAAKKGEKEASRLLQGAGLPQEWYAQPRVSMRPWGNVERFA